MSMADGPAAVERISVPAAEDAGRGGSYDWLAEAALVSVTVVVAAGMSRLFTDTSFLRDVLALALAAHVVAAAARRVGLPTIGAALLSVACFAITATVLLYTGTAWFVLPTADTVSLALDHLVDGWDVANASPAPVAPVPGLVLSAGAVLALCAFLADAAAFRLRSAGWAVAPTASIYGFTAAFGTGDAAILYGMLCCVAIGVTMVALWLRNRRAEAWIESMPGRGMKAMARAAGAALLLAVAAGAVAGPSLPGARAEPWVDLERFEVTDAAPWVDVPPPDPEPWADFGSPGVAGSASLPGSAEGARVLVSPLVQVRSRLIDLTEEELFTVAVPEDQRHYWRLTSLDDFDGDAWRARSQYEDASGPLAATLDPSAAGASLQQTVMLTGLGNSYLPVAYELRRVIDDGGVAMEYEAYSGSLIKGRRVALEGPGRFSYVVDSAVPAIGDPDRLRQSETSMLEEGFLATNTQLPDDVRDLVRAQTERITSDARSDYHRALQLQDYFRLDGGFRYDLQVHAAGGIESLEEFLFEARAGYCQQFASAYAAMARSIGLPTRVAVGFTWGEWDSERGVGGAYVVRGKHAHAWPEVYFAGTGWIRFEPTPGRGAPGDFAVTGHVADQAGGGLGAAAGGPDEGLELSETPGRSAAPDTPGLVGDDSDERSGLARRSEPSADAGPGDSASSGRPSLVLLAVLALAALGSAVGMVPVLRRLRWRRHRDRVAHDPAGLIDFWWTNALDALALVRLGPRPFETPLELARRVVSVRPAVGPLQELAVLVTHGRYARETPPSMAIRRVVSVRPAVGPLQELAVLVTHGRYARETPPSMAIRAGVVASLVAGACRRQASPLSRLAAAVDPTMCFTRRRRG